MELQHHVPSSLCLPLSPLYSPSFIIISSSSLYFYPHDLVLPFIPSFFYFPFTYFYITSLHRFSLLFSFFCYLPIVISSSSFDFYLHDLLLPFIPSFFFYFICLLYVLLFPRLYYSLSFVIFLYQLSFLPSSSFVPSIFSIFCFFFSFFISLCFVS